MIPERTFRALTTAAFAIAVCALALAASKTVPAPAPEKLPALAASLAERLLGTAVTTPSGERIEVGALLPVKRLEQSLATVSEAEAWPAAWLVVQDAGRDFDLVLRLRLDAKGDLETPTTIFAASRREWDDASLETAVEEATGAKAPRERERSLVIQSFSKRTETSYVYDIPAAAKGDKGLLPLLPEGSLIREARSLDLGDGRRHTLAIVLSRPRFVPSDCDSCKDRLYGHADAGAVSLVLAGESALEHTLDLTAALKGEGKEALLPRYACTDDDRAAGRRGAEDRFRGREPVPLLELEDYDGDGRSLEIAFEGEFLDCNRHASVVVGIGPSEPKLRLLVPRGS